MKLSSFVILIVLFVASCDYISPQRKFKLAIPEGDYSYNYSGLHLKTFLEHKGYEIEIISATNAIEANNLVATGMADLSFVLNHSLFITDTLKDHSNKLRTILPMFDRFMFFFAKDSLDELVISHYLENKTVNLEVLNGETHAGLAEMLNLGDINNVKFVSNDKADLHHFWGNFNGVRAEKLSNNGWKSVSIDKEWQEFLLLNNPALEAFSLPAIPGSENEHTLTTVATETLLVGSASLGENAIHQLSEYIFQHRLKLMSYDRMYASIDEHFDTEHLLYPLHEGTEAYLRREDPSFLERYADSLAFILSLLALAYGGIQAIKNALAKRRKDRVDMYFIEFLNIREKEMPVLSDLEREYDRLLHKILIQMTNEKLDKNDFHILSRLIQQELTNLKFNK